jgi:fumarylpyruvate hydrolase
MVPKKQMEGTTMQTNRRNLLKTGLAGGAAVAAPAAAAAQGSAPALVFAAHPQVTVPIVGTAQRFPVRRIYCAGFNYLAHRRELNQSLTDPAVFFAKHRDMIVQPGGTCAYPGITKDYQHEIELVVAMKSGGLNIPVERALDHVYGYAVGLDMTRRDWQNTMKAKQGPWEVSKSFEDSAPCGAISTVAQVGHLKEGRIVLTVNGQTRQDSDLANMMWNAAELISQLSAQAEIRAGDLIYTGTPAGVSALQKGDRLLAKIDKLSDLAVTVV